MIVNRRTFFAKRGRLKEAIALNRAEMERTDSTARVCVSETGLFDTISMEFEFESLEEYEKSWEEYFSSPEAAPFLEKWAEVTEPGGTNELWRLVK